MSITNQSRKRFSLRWTITTKILSSITIVLLSVFVVSSWYEIQKTQESIQAKGDEQKAQLLAVYEEQYQNAAANLQASLKPKLDMITLLAEVPLNEMRAATLIERDDAKILEGMQTCFQHEGRRLVRCARKYIHFTQIHKKQVADSANDLVTIVVRSILQEPDLVAIWVQTEDGKRYTGFQKNEFGSLEFLEDLSQLRPGLLKVEKKNREEFGTITIYYSNTRLESIRQAGQDLVAKETQALEQKIDQEIRDAFIASLIEALIQFLVLLVAVAFVAFSTVIRPLNRLKEVADELAQGNWNKSIETDRQDELGSLARSFANMRGAIQEMLGLIQEQNRTLEQKVAERTAQLKQKTNDINSMLQNMHQGVFTILESGRIHPEYSAFVRNILEVEEVAGQPAVDLLFANADLGPDQIHQIQTTLDSLIGSDAMMFDFNKHLLVPEILATFSDDHKKILELEWDPIVAEDDSIEKIMVTLRDATELRGLQEAAEQQRHELEIIGQILALQQHKFETFLQTSHQFLQENEQLIQSTPAKEMEVLASLFRNMHTIKGNARMYGLLQLTDAVHQAEQTYDQLRKEDDLPWDQIQLLEELRQTQAHIEKYEQVFRTKLGDFAKQSQGVYWDQYLMEKLRSYLTDTNKNSLDDLTQTIQAIEQVFQAIGSETLESILEDLIQDLPRLAHDLGKAEPRVILADSQIRFSQGVIPTLKDVFMHIFRNSLDHGLESPSERLQLQKPEQGVMELSLQTSDQFVEIHFQDDGRGLGLERLREKAQQEGWVKETVAVPDEAAADFIFQSGMTTTETVTSISGRGVGMDAVKRFLQHQGGNIVIELLDESTRNQAFRPFKQIICLPKESGFQL